jgi:hypothetical protein
LKDFIDSFKDFLTEGKKNDYIEGSSITLYHYSPADDKEITLDPKYFGKSSFSKKERESSTVPRVFFYVNLSQREKMVSSNRKLYSVNIHENILYDLNMDPEGYKESIRHPVYGLRKGIELDELLNKIKENYSGTFYTTGGMDVVAWFQPISVERVTDDERKHLEVQE